MATVSSLSSRAYRFHPLLYRLSDIRHMENGFTWLLLVAVILVGLFLWKQQLGAAVIALLALYSVLAHARYMGMFAIPVATLGGPLLSEVFVGSTSIISTVGRPGKARHRESASRWQWP